MIKNMDNINHPEVCLVCKEGREIKFISGFEKNGQKSSLYQCSDCKVQFFFPMKNPGADWYKQTSDYSVRSLSVPRVWRGSQKRFLKRHKEFSGSSIALELGCGSGEFLNEIKKKGCIVLGVDFDSKGIELAKKFFSLESVFAMEFNDFFKKANLPKFDYIFFFEVIEHLDNPLEFIRNAKNALKPSGKIILSTPSRERMLANWTHWDFPPHHLTRWDYQSIKNIFGKIGFKITYSCYDEPYKMIAGTIDSKFRSGLVNKVADVWVNDNKSKLFAEIMYILAKAKYYVLGGVPASLLWVLGKLTGKHNGTMYFEMMENP